MTRYALGCIATAVALGCFIKWPVEFLTVGALLVALVVCIAVPACIVGLILFLIHWRRAAT